MTSKAIAKYKIHQRLWEQACAKLGRPHDEAALDALKLKTIGRVCSSKDFLQSHFDDMLAAFLAVIRSADLNAQMRQIEMPEWRARMAVRRIEVLKLHLCLESGRESGYVAGIARNLFGQEDGQWHQLDAAKLGKLEGVILRRLRQLHGAGAKITAIEAEAAAHAAKAEQLMTRAKPAPVAVEDENPF